MCTYSNEILGSEKIVSIHLNTECVACRLNVQFNVTSSVNGAFYLLSDNEHLVLHLYDAANLNCTNTNPLVLAGEAVADDC